MTTDRNIDLGTMLEDALGPSIEWEGHRVWAPAGKGFEVVLGEETMADGALKELRARRDGGRAASVIAVCPAPASGLINIAGPTGDRSVRSLPIDAVVDVFEQSMSDDIRDTAGAFIERNLRWIDESVLPGVRVKDLLTPYYVRERLLHGNDRDWLAKKSAKVTARVASRGWRPIIEALGWTIEGLGGQRFLLKDGTRTAAVLHAKPTEEAMSRMSPDGVLPEGALISDCAELQVNFGILAHGSRLRLFRANPAIGSAVSRFIEIDVSQTNEHGRIVVATLSPGSLRHCGRFYDWEQTSRDFGEQLRVDLQQRLIDSVLPGIAKGIGRWREAHGADLSQREELVRIEEAVLTLVFRFMFLLHVEARDYLPMSSNSQYRELSARGLAERCTEDKRSYASDSTTIWDLLKTLVHIIRNGNPQLNVPQYNGSLFASDGFPGAELLESVSIGDDYLAPALNDIAFDPKTPGIGLDYASLQVGHLGAIYEALLSRRLVLARVPLVFETRRDLYSPANSGERPDVEKGSLFYQSETGGRKAGGVYYTPHEFVEHLLEHSLTPGLNDHFDRVAALSSGGHDQDAAKQLFEFFVVDPAMGSGHFLTAALDIMADRFDGYLTGVGGLDEIRDELSKLRSHIDESTYEVDDVDLLRRLILKRCLYGVDISPLAVEIANVTVWLASFVPGLALSYLGGNLRCGDALVGVADPQEVVDAAGTTLFSDGLRDAMEYAVASSRRLRSILDVNARQVQESMEADLDVQAATGNLRKAYDLWTAEPLGLKGGREVVEVHAGRLLECGNTGSFQGDSLVVEATVTANEFRFMHWPLEFPLVFSSDNAGFDVVVGNPPWDELTIERLGFFSMHYPGLQGIKDPTEQATRLRDLEESRPDLQSEFQSRQSRLETLRRYLREGGNYQFRGGGDPDLYRFFSERYAAVIRPEGHLGVVLPGGSLVNKGSTGFRSLYFGETTVNRVDTILNSGRWAFPITDNFQIMLLASKFSDPPEGHQFVYTGGSASAPQFAESIKLDQQRISQREAASGSPLPRISNIDQSAVYSALTFGPRFDALNLSMFAPKSGNPDIPNGKLAPHSELHETKSKSLFSREDGLPVWKGRSFRPYDPHGRDPAGFADQEAVFDLLATRRRRSHVLKPFFSEDELRDFDTHPITRPRIAFRDVAGSLDTDIVIACLVPPGIPLTNTAPYVVSRWPANELAFLLGVLNSTSFDWQASRFVQRHLSIFIMKMLRFPPVDFINATPASPVNPSEPLVWQRIAHLAASLSCVDDRFADFAAATGVEVGRQPDDVRLDQRAEIDALVARAYGLTDDQTRFLFEDYPAGAFKGDGPFANGFPERVMDHYDRIGELCVATGS